MGNPFLIDSSTIFDCLSETFQLPDGSYVSCEVLDTGGLEKFDSINRKYYQRKYDQRDQRQQTVEKGGIGFQDNHGTITQNNYYGNRKTFWKQLKQGIDIFVRRLGQIILLVIAFIIGLIWFLIKCVIALGKQVGKFVGWGNGGSIPSWA